MPTIPGSRDTEPVEPLNRPDLKKKELWDVSLVDLIDKQVGLIEALSYIEAALIRQALDFTEDNVVHAADILKIPRGTLRYKMEKHGLVAADPLQQRLPGT